MIDSEILYRILITLEKIERALIPADPTALIKINERLTKLMERWDGISPAKSKDDICRWYGVPPVKSNEEKQSDPFLGHFPAFIDEVNAHTKPIKADLEGDEYVIRIPKSLQRKTLVAIELNSLENAYLPLELICSGKNMQIPKELLRRLLGVAA